MFQYFFVIILDVISNYKSPIKNINNILRKKGLKNISDIFVICTLSGYNSAVKQSFWKKKGKFKSALKSN